MEAKIPVYLIQLLFCGGFVSQQAMAANEDYLNAVKADVNEFSTHSFDPLAGSSWSGTDDALAVDDTQGGSLGSFSDYLKTKSPGTYIFFQKIPSEIQRRVHQEYLLTGDFERTKTSIFNYSTDFRKK